MNTLRRTWADISLENLEHNYRVLRCHVPHAARFLGVVKADAYGHGAVAVSRALSQFGAEYLAVSNLEEAVQIRRAHVGTPILILGFTPPEFAEDMACLGITQEVHSLDYAQALEQALSGTGFTLNVHLKIDTGMTRIGFLAIEQERSVGELLQVCKLRHLHAEGIFMHFSSADSTAAADEAYTALQYARFTSVLDALAACGVKPEIRHCCNSGATILHPDYALDMIRPGVATYGLPPAPDCSGKLDLRPIMSVHSSVAQIRDLPAGCSVSYGRTFVTDRPMRVAVIPMGYADGLMRTLSGKVSFRLHGKQAKNIGRICMDMCMIDVSQIPEAKVGDTVTLFGYDEAGTLIPCESVSDLVPTISYEILTSMDKRIPRFYLRDGKQSDILQYIV